MTPFTMGLAVAVASVLNPPTEDVASERLIGALRELPERRSAGGDAAHHAGLAEAEEWIARTLRESGYDPTLERIEWSVPTHAEPTVWNNIVVEIVGRTRPREVLLVGAHFDAVPMTPGADDNGTGTAALLELARVFKDFPAERTVRFVFFNLEEVGLVGSRQYAAKFRERQESAPEGERETIVGMLSLEMLGYFRDDPASQKSPIKEVKGVFTPPTVGDFIALVTTAAHREFNGVLAGAMESAAPGLKVARLDFMPVAVPDMLRSDHAPFLALGVPAVMVTDTANFRNPNYHKPTDTADTIDTARFTLVVKGLAGAVEKMAKLPNGQMAK